MATLTRSSVSRACGDPIRGTSARDPRRRRCRTEGRSPKADRATLLARGILGIVATRLLDPASVEVILDETTGGIEPPQRGPAPARLIVHGTDALANLLFPPTEEVYAAAFLRGDVDIEGDVMAAVAAASAADIRRLSADDARRLVRWGMALRRGAPPPPTLRRVARMRGSRHSRARDLAAIRFHYDVGEAFYQLWLDRRLTYSCAYFPDGTSASDAATRLDEAQEAKLRLIARKLGAEAGMRMLDIGSGWGSLVQYVAQEHGTEAVGITLSRRQADEANTRARAAGIADRARSEVRDYRDIAPLGTFDIAASVGMFEHVGRANLPLYFGAAHSALRPGGRFLNHGIAATRRPGRFGSASPGRFIDRFVFPDGELVTIEEAVRVAHDAGFEVIDVASLRPHYALTLAAWVERLEGRSLDAVAAAGEEVVRTWRLYLSAARLGFEQGGLDVYQMLLARPRGQRRPATRPLRPWW